MDLLMPAFLFFKSLINFSLLHNVGFINNLGMWSADTCFSDKATQ